MAYKQGFLHFSILVLVLVSWGIISPDAFAGVNCDVSSNSSSDARPVLIVQNEIVGGTAQQNDFLFTVVNNNNDAGGPYQQTGTETGAIFENLLDAGTFVVEPSTLLSYSFALPSCQNNNAISNGDIITYTIVSTYQNTPTPESRCDIDKTEAADVNDDDVVNTEDYDFVQSHIGCDVSAGGACAKSDVNDDGVVNPSDFTAIRGQIGCRINEPTAPVAETLPAPPQSGSSGSSQIILPVVQGQVLGALVINWSALSATEKEELIAPFRQQLLDLIRQLLALINSQTL